MIQFNETKGVSVKRNQAVLIYGLPASGKYTMAKQLQEKDGGILLDNHYFYDMFRNIIKVPQERKQEYFGKVAELRKVFLDIVKCFQTNRSSGRKQLLYRSSHLQPARPYRGHYADSINTSLTTSEQDSLFCITICCHLFL